MKNKFSFLILTLSTCISVTTIAQTEDFAVLDKNTINYLPSNLKDFESTILTDQEIKLVDSLYLNFKLKSHNSTTKIQVMDKIGLMQYKRQYLPLLNKKNEKIIWINALCAAYFSYNTSDRWKKDVIVIKDGGSCFFSVILNLNTKEFDQLEVNGES